MTDQELNERYWLDGVDDALITVKALFEKKIYHQVYDSKLIDVTFVNGTRSPRRSCNG